MRKHSLKDTLVDRIMPIVTNKEQPCGNIRYYAQGGMTCFVLRGTDGDLLIDTGMPQIWNGLQRWLGQYQIKHVLLTHAHADHDWNAAKLQKAGGLLCLSRPEAPRSRLQRFTSAR